MEKKFFEYVPRISLITLVPLFTHSKHEDGNAFLLTLAIMLESTGHKYCIMIVITAITSINFHISYIIIV